MKNWIQAARPKTLPLALATILMGISIAMLQTKINVLTASMAILTCFLLQILSNLANDLGDAINGADNELRVGPERMVNSGKITVPKMKKGVVLFSILSFLSGIIMLWASFDVIGWNGIYGLLGLGLISILAAITYTAGKNPYGYRALGDLSVLIFFGVVGVGGTYFLLSGNIQWNVLFPALGFGCFATGVLNINNMRDIETDKLAGKITIPVLLGRQKAKIYHLLLIIIGLTCFCIYAMKIDNFILYLPIFLGSFFFAYHLMGIFSANKPADFIPFLKQLALLNLIFSIIFYGTVLFLVFEFNIVR